MSTVLDDAPGLGVAILDRVFESSDGVLTADAARSLLSLKFKKVDERRMNRLSAKAQKGTLTDLERLEAEQFNLVSHLLALLQIRARQTLRQLGEDEATA